MSVESGLTSARHCRIPRTGYDTTPKRWTYEDYYRSTAEGEWFEFIDGVNLGAERSKLTVHQEWLGAIIGLFRPKFDKIGKLILGPVDVVFDNANVVQPDLLFVTAPRKDIVEERGVFGGPDITIEIISPATLVMDRYRKLALYARFAIKEYWLVDPGHSSIEILALDGDRYDLSSFASYEGRVRSIVLNAEFDLSDVAPRDD